MSLIKSAPSLCFALLLAGCSPASKAQSQQVPSSMDMAAVNSNALVEISESRAFTLLKAALEEQLVSDLECLSFDSESDIPAGSTAAFWEFAAREIHNEKCGGDPETSPVRDRYKVSSNGEVLIYDFPTGEYTTF
ncbi:hypothetical protein [Luteimonas sp. MC1825]|uniref:hypothetical protein n=1 Tax=Luteimonas sp. MC1825 TaxID=2761107 RepID=UPI0016175837|nr:hypothetical protein [Luteimonas sp. MC1825]MBB6600629.1 hypothetical protein [Luteimonas sp. MC1825]QOC88231.1 hypothetical protein IDM46_00150 [Luteimonas sp. MC1825]